MFEDALSANSILIQFLNACCSVLNESSSIIDKPKIVQTKSAPMIELQKLNQEEIKIQPPKTGIFVSAEPVDILASKQLKEEPKIESFLANFLKKAKKNAIDLINSSNLLNKTANPIDKVHIQLDLFVLKCTPFNKGNYY